MLIYQIWQSKKPEEPLHMYMYVLQIAAMLQKGIKKIKTH